jgi:hypothetical protein
VTPVAELQVQPRDSEPPHTGGSQPRLLPTSGGQVQLPFRQTGAIAVVVVQP